MDSNTDQSVALGHWGVPVTPAVIVTPEPVIADFDGRGISPIQFR